MPEDWRELFVGDKRMLIVDTEVARMVDENRGVMSRSEFIAFLVQPYLREGSEDKTPDRPEPATKADVEKKQQNTGESLEQLRRVLDQLRLGVQQMAEEQSTSEQSTSEQSASEQGAAEPTWTLRSLGS